MDENYGYFKKIINAIKENKYLKELKNEMKKYSDFNYDFNNLIKNQTPEFNTERNFRYNNYNINIENQKENSKNKINSSYNNISSFFSSFCRLSPALILANNSLGLKGFVI